MTVFFSICNVDNVGDFVSDKVDPKDVSNADVVINLLFAMVPAHNSNDGNFGYDVDDAMKLTDLADDAKQEDSHDMADIGYGHVAKFADAWNTTHNDDVVHVNPRPNAKVLDKENECDKHVVEGVHNANFVDDVHVQMSEGVYAPNNGPNVHNPNKSWAGANDGIDDTQDANAIVGDDSEYDLHKAQCVDEPKHVHNEKFIVEMQAVDDEHLIDEVEGVKGVQRVDDKQA